MLAPNKKLHATSNRYCVTRAHPRSQ